MSPDGRGFAAEYDGPRFRMGYFDQREGELSAAFVRLVKWVLAESVVLLSAGVLLGYKVFSDELAHFPHQSPLWVRAESAIASTFVLIGVVLLLLSSAYLILVSFAKKSQRSK